MIDEVLQLGHLELRVVLPLIEANHLTEVLLVGLLRVRCWVLLQFLQRLLHGDGFLVHLFIHIRELFALGFAAEE